MHRHVIVLAALMAVTVVDGQAAMGAASGSLQAEAEAQVVPFAVGESQPLVKVLHVADQVPLSAENTLEPAWMGAADQLSRMRRWNRAGNEPRMNGFARTLPVPIVGSYQYRNTVRTSSTGLAISQGDEITWGTRIRVLGAERLRLHIQRVALPFGAYFVAWAPGQKPQVFGLELMSPDQAIWTPSVLGDEFLLEVHAPKSATGIPRWFEIDEALEIISEPVATCYVDATCVTNSNLAQVDQLRHAVSYLEFVAGGNSFTCSGGLINDTDSSSVIPYLLTANHCISDQTTAASLEAFWDYRTTTCGGSFPNPASLPKSNGGTLLATSVQSDFALIRLNSIPANRVLLGWTTAAVPAGADLYRIAHPNGYPQAYSVAQRLASALHSCPSDPGGRPLNDSTKFIHEQEAVGAVFHGSSGGLAVNANLQVLGQLFGACGSGSGTECSSDIDVLDGAFSATYANVATWINPSTNTGPCARDATTACLLGGRFEVKVDFTSSTSGAAQVMSFGGQRTENDQSVFWWFFDPNNFEMGLKMLNACGLNNSFWVFISGLTNQGWTVHVRDTQTGAVKIYQNALNHLSQTTADTAALSCP